MSKFKVGDRIRIVTDAESGHYGIASPECFVKAKSSDGVVVTEINESSLKWADRYGCNWPVKWFALVKSLPTTKAQREIAKAEAVLQSLKDRAAKKAKDAAERKAKAERAKPLKGLTAGGKRIVEALRAKPEAFGCQREVAIALAAAITGDKADDIRKALL